jgi:hypothetical protein
VTVPSRYRAWLIEVLQWVKTAEADLEALADHILETLTKGGEPTTPPPEGGT